MLSGTTEVDIDDDELLAELEALQKEDAIKLDAAIPAPPKSSIEFANRETETEIETVVEPAERLSEAEAEAEAELA